jgi:hypothetical protein
MNLIAAGAFCLVVGREYIYYICKDRSNHHDRFYKTDLTDTIEVAIDEYAVLKFGNAWKAIHSPDTECIWLSDGDYLSCSFESSMVYRHNYDGTKVHTYDIAPLTTGFDTIYSITLDSNGYLWLAQPSEHVIAQYDLNTENQLFKLGGGYDLAEPLNYPEQVRAYGDAIYVSELGNNRVSKINIYTKELTEYLHFDEPAWEYAQFKGYEVVRLKSGLYVV